MYTPHFLEIHVEHKMEKILGTPNILEITVVHKSITLYKYCKIMYTPHFLEIHIAYKDTIIEKMDTPKNMEFENECLKKNMLQFLDKGIIAISLSGEI